MSGKTETRIKLAFLIVGVTTAVIAFVLIRFTLDAETEKVEQTLVVPLVAALIATLGAVISRYFGGKQ